MFSVLEPVWLLLLLMPEINLCHCTATTSKQKGNDNSKWTSHLTSNSQTRTHGLSSYATSRFLDTGHPQKAEKAVTHFRLN